MDQSPDVRARVLPRPDPRWSVGVALAAALLALTWVGATQSGISTLEVEAFRWGNSLDDASWHLLWPVMQAGNLVAPIVVATGALLALRRWRPSLEVVVSAYAGWAVAAVIKDTVARGRPGAYLSDVLLREPAHGLGFVSGHVAVTTAMVTALWPRLPRAGRAVAAAVVVAVALGRVVAGAHLPLDVIGGAAVGVLVGLVVRLVARVADAWRTPRRREVPATA